MEKWNPEYEMEYWNSVTDNGCRNKIMSKYKYFNVDEVVKNNFEGSPVVAIDIAGGMWGGALQFFDAEKKILIDYLADEFVRIGKMNGDINAVNGDFCNLPLEDDSVDVVFCWEAFDHCNSMDDFRMAQEEVVRVMSKGGLLFFEMPIRTKPIDGHPISLADISRDDIVRGFCKLKMIKRVDSGPEFESPSPIMLVMKK